MSEQPLQDGAKEAIPVVMTQADYDALMQFIADTGEALMKLSARLDLLERIQMARIL